MIETDTSKIINFDKLTGYQIELFNRLKPLLDLIDNYFLSDESEIKVYYESRKWCLEISVIPNLSYNLKLHSMLIIYATNREFSLGFAGGEFIECHDNADYEIGKDLTNIISLISKFLNGIFIQEHLNKKNKLIKTIVYFGDKADVNNIASTSRYRLELFNKCINIISTKVNYLKKM